MTSAPNRLQPSSGNRRYLFVIIALLAAACSPKIRTVTVQPPPVHKEPEKKIVEVTPTVPKKVVKKAEPKVSTVSLLLPFGLDHLRTGSAGYTSVTIKEADIAVDYYRGFKLALDSLSSEGYNFKVRVFDSRGETAQAHSLAANPQIKASNLVVGPVFPDDIKAFSDAYSNPHQLVVSPLSAAPPEAIKNANLVSLIPPLEYHAWAAAQYINDVLKAKKVFILKSGFSDENEYLTPFKNAIDSLSNKRIKVIITTAVHGQLKALTSQLSTSGQNVFVIASTNQRFLAVTLRGLDSLGNNYPITLFGHPSWVGLSYLPADVLQRLDTHVTIADHVDYKAANTLAFMQQYRQAYKAEATPYAIKGFDEGLYLGKLLATDSLSSLGSEDFDGIHNIFHLQKKNGVGLINTHVNIFKYANFELLKVE
jgi:ABC-type branched-subunit amino acid transport system substrate-binding protein